MDDHIINRYETDFYLWLEQQAALLRAGRFDLLDQAHLIEEIEGMALSQKHELVHRLEILLMHLLKCQFQSHRISRGWLGTIQEQRERIEDRLEDMPSLKPLLKSRLNKAYDRAIRHAVIETRLPRTAFPGTCPYTVEQILDIDFIPGPQRKSR